MEHKINSGKYGSVHYWVTGQSERCIVFTHGATMDHDLFQHQIDFFSEQHKVITWDVPQHGLSRPYKGFSLQRAAIELIQILDAEMIEKAHLVGQSMGGYILQIVARDHPERVLSLTAVDSSPMQPSYYSKLDVWLLSITPPLLRLYPYNYLIRTIANQIAVQKEAREYALDTLQNLSKEEIVEIMRVVYEGVNDYQFDSILPVPTLITYGEADRSGKVQKYCQQWSEREGKPVRIIPNAAHNANMDNPDVFNQILKEFVEKPEFEPTLPLKTEARST